MEKESSPVAVEDKYAQRFSVKWIFTPRKFAFKKTNNSVKAYCTLRNEMERNEMERNEMERNEMKNLYFARRNGTKRNEKSKLCETKWDETK